MSKMLKGMVLTVVAGISWGLSGASGQYLLANGFSALPLTNIRLLVAGFVLLGAVYLTDKNKVLRLIRDKKSMVTVVLFALFGLVLNQFSYLLTIHETNAGTATVLQYLCPILILLYSCFKTRTAPTLMELLSIFFAFFGTVLIATHGDLTQLSITTSGLFLGIFSAFTYSLYILIPIQIIRDWGTMLVIGLGMAISGIALLPFSGLGQLQLKVTVELGLALVGIILIGTILAYTLFLKGSGMIGPVKSSLLASIEPIAAVFFSFLIMGEQFFAIDFLGMGMILLGVSLISVRDLLNERKNHIHDRD
ncbi:Drug/metabolite transporter (DMT) superfamily protein [Streptococcus sp. DD10]|uniref:DMT family transporter n=1 Tax=Streptococcus sp. DD10 TaxID=1777878 RepID=UPI0007914708|nr:EamA family transporter [Streptococcus sp. DD10]KXT74028.1 Drug/metabolite transporter (DMT) superfamily protein [Streptococcus sp. DD10]